MFLKWEKNQTIPFICVAKWLETPDTISIQISPQHSHLPIHFKSGQFVNIAVEIDSKLYYRSYSISSLPNLPFLQLTIKRTNNGVVSNYIFNHFNIDDCLEVMEPCGKFNIEDCLHDQTGNINADNIVLISAGSGITPVYGIAADLVKNTDKNITFLHIAKDIENTIFYDELLSLDKKYTNFDLSLLLKNSANSPHSQGRLDLAYLKQQIMQQIESRHNTAIFICGPEQFMQNTQNYLEQLNFDLNHCYLESFSSSLEPDLSASLQDSAPQTVQINMPKLTKQFEAKQGDVLADVLENAQVPIIIACRSGICGACKCKVTEGSVNMNDQSVLTEAEIEQGYVLACSSIVNENISLEI